MTPAGQRIVEQAQRVLEEASRIKEIAAAGRDPLAGPLRLGAIYTIGPYLLPKLMPILRKTAPAMQLLIQENFTHRLGRDAEERRGRRDPDRAALRGAGDRDARGLRRAVLRRGAQGPSLGRRKRVTTEELTDESLLLLGEGHCFRDQVLEICHTVRAQGAQRARAHRGGRLARDDPPDGGGRRRHHRAARDFDAAGSARAT